MKTRSSLNKRLGKVEQQNSATSSPQGSLSCGHSEDFRIQSVCGLCYIVQGFQAELPGRLHLTRTLADNGNPQQSPKLISHMKVAEGLKTPKKGENLHRWSLARVDIIGTQPAPHIFPVTSALWMLMGRQPPLAEPLILMACGKNLEQVAQKMTQSWWNIHVRLDKAVRLVMISLRDYDVKSRALST